MALRTTNPFIDQDISNIINAYTTGVNAQDTEASVTTILTPDVRSHSEFARNIIDRLRSYTEHSTSSSQSPEFEFAGLKIQNTFNTIKSADSVGDALKTAAADCIPCNGRILALLNLNPLDDLVDLLNRDIDRRFDALFSILDLLNNTDIFNDICEVLRELNFFCIPDLQRIAMLLTLLLGKYKQNLDLGITLPESLIGGLFAPFLSSLNTLLDQYIQMVIAPIECIIDHLNFQIQKLDIQEGITKAQNQLNKENPKSTDGYIPDITDPLRKISTEPLGDALSNLTNYLSQGKQYVDSSLAFMREQLEQLLKTQTGISFDTLANAKNKLNLIRLISLIMSIINATKAGGLDCGDLQSIDSTKKLRTFLNNYIRPNTRININLYNKSNEQVITIQSPSIPDAQSTAIAEIIMNSNKDLPLTSGSRIVDGKVIKPESTILVKNCLRNIDKQDLDKVQQWISEFEKGNI